MNKLTIKLPFTNTVQGEEQLVVSSYKDGSLSIRHLAAEYSTGVIGFNNAQEALDYCDELKSSILSLIRSEAKEGPIKLFTLFFKDGGYFLVQGNTLAVAYAKFKPEVLKEIKEDLDFWAEGNKIDLYHFDIIAKAWGLIEPPIDMGASSIKVSI